MRPHLPRNRRARSCYGHRLTAHRHGASEEDPHQLLPADAHRLPGYFQDVGATSSSSTGGAMASGGNSGSGGSAATGGSGAAAGNGGFGGMVTGTGGAPTGSGGSAGTPGVGGNSGPREGQARKVARRARMGAAVDAPVLWPAAVAERTRTAGARRLFSDFSRSHGRAAGQVELARARSKKSGGFEAPTPGRWNRDAHTTAQTMALAVMEEMRD